MDTMRGCFCIFSFILLTACQKTETPLTLIPYPQSLETMNGTFVLPDTIGFTAQMCGDDLQDLIAYLPDYPLILTDDIEGCLHMTINRQMGEDPESYTLTVSERGIEIASPAAAGLFYGLQTLAQMAGCGKELSYVTVKDAPRYAYRGMHLDVSRHFFGTEFIKKQLDAMASYKLNRFHWHLTDGAGWRLEIPELPELTRLAAWRPKALWKEWWAGERHYCTADTAGAYGGFFTADDVRGILEYARLRHITVIPEIETPGHSEEVLAAYPNLACSGKPYTDYDVCIGNEETFFFFEKVLDVVMELFPSEYIHIGGDEAGKEQWKSCPKCRKRMKTEGLADVNELQSYMICRIERYLNEHGRKIIGWDEILEGGVAPNATVMSWRGTEGGIAAAQSGHDAIMTPGEYCYFDHYQTAPNSQPEAIGGYLPIEKVYSYNPTPAEWNDSISRHILGVQANLWAEYIPDDFQMEYMIYPRLLALAEVGWTLLEHKDWENFKIRTNREIKNLQAKGYNPFPLTPFPMAVQRVNMEKKCIEVELHTERYPVEIRYTLDGSEPTASSRLYKNPICIKDSTDIRARLYDGQKAIGETAIIHAIYHKGIGAKAVYAEKGGYYTHDERYKAGGDTALVDGLRGGSTYTDGRWQGFCPRDMDVTIDLGMPMGVHRVTANFMQDIGPWIFFPSKVELFFSVDGSHFIPIAKDTCDVAIDAPGCLLREFGWCGAEQQVRYIRYRAFQSEKGAFIFTDEITVQ